MLRFVILKKFPISGCEQCWLWLILCFYTGKECLWCKNVCSWCCHQNPCAETNSKDKFPSDLRSGKVQCGYWLLGLEVSILFENSKSTSFQSMFSLPGHMSPAVFFFWNMDVPRNILIPSGNYRTFFLDFTEEVLFLITNVPLCFWFLDCLFLSAIFDGLAL